MGIAPMNFSQHTERDNGKGRGKKEREKERASERARERAREREREQKREKRKGKFYMDTRHVLLPAESWTVVLCT